MVVIMVGTASGRADVLADKYGAFDTDDGWQVSLYKTNEELKRWPNMAATAFSREAFLSMKAMARIGGTGSAPVIAGTVSAGIQIGCQIDVSSGMTVGAAANLGLSLGVNGGITISYPPAGTLGANAGANAGVVPNLQATLRPGGITSLTLDAKPLASSYGSTHLRELYVKTDGCGGYVSIRTFAAVQVATPNANDSYSIYGDPTWL
ncbi:MspA family porin [Nocardia sp. 2]|uniref:MspA family porin n=2 Tax=Nocardia acididurans TaxID=2802282 RepID=A0ABS1MG08_9NOCA|nr:MspA family porin [Nocardia acididurans]